MSEVTSAMQAPRLGGRGDTERLRLKFGPRAAV